MGKIKKQRQKLHISPSNKLSSVAFTSEDNSETNSTLPLDFSSSDTNIFAGVNINLNNLNKNLSDVRSVKSYKSVKSEKGESSISKKDKRKLKHEVLLQRIDSLNEMKKELKLREKRKNVTLIGDTNPLHDALPSLEELIKNRSKFNYKINNESGKKKGIEKAKKRKKKLIQDVNTFKSILKNKKYQENPLTVISNHIKAIISQNKK